MDNLVYEVVINSAEGVADVESQKLQVVIDEQLIDTMELNSGAQVAEIVVPQDSNVQLVLSYLDDAGNESAPLVTEFVAEDTLPPEAPIAFGTVTLVSEFDGVPPSGI